MNTIVVAGTGAVSPGGWGIPSFRAALSAGMPLPVQELPRPGWKRPLRIRRVPAPSAKPAFLAHARLRRSSPISHYAVAAALEALGEDAPRVASAALRLGIILCVMSGCVNYSRRFYDEVLRDPSTASPLVFPETVFNAPSSHLAALLGTTEINYTLVGDPGTFLQGVALGAEWLLEEMVDGCVVVGSEEADWLTADAFRMFSRGLILGDGAGALYLRRDRAGEGGVTLDAVTEPQLFFNRASREAAAMQTAQALCSGASTDLLCDGLQGQPFLDRAEIKAWKDWSGARISPKRVLGEGLMAGAAWQCVAAIEELKNEGRRSALVCVAGTNQQVIGARFRRQSSS